MNIHEYQAKALLRSYGAPVSDGRVVLKAEDAKTAAGEMDGPLWVVKAQIHAGGRGKGTFKEADAGDKGGVRLEPFGFYRPVVVPGLAENRGGWKVTYEIDPGPPLLADSVDVRISGPGAENPVHETTMRSVTSAGSIPARRRAPSAAVRASAGAFFSYASILACVERAGTCWSGITP